MARRPPLSKRNLERLHMNVAPDWLEAVDTFRAQQPGITPNRSDTIRALVEWAIERHKGPLRPPKR